MLALEKIDTPPPEVVKLLRRKYLILKEPEHKTMLKPGFEPETLGTAAKKSFQRRQEGKKINRSNERDGERESTRKNNS